MAEFVFDFCTGTRVAEVIPPEEASVQDFNGWDYTPNPTLPFRRSFKIKLFGLRWYQNPNGSLDLTTDPSYNAGRLEGFYAAHRRHKPFNYVHEYLGNLEVRFAQVLAVPAAMVESGGLIEPLEIKLLHHNPSY